MNFKLSIIRGNSVYIISNIVINTQTAEVHSANNDSLNLYRKLGVCIIYYIFKTLQQEREKLRKLQVCHKSGAARKQNGNKLIMKTVSFATVVVKANYGC